jgi:hypothetical protein
MLIKNKKIPNIANWQINRGNIKISRHQRAIDHLMQI